jgi:cytochrome c oxidase assembly protein subunit 11
VKPRRNGLLALALLATIAGMTGLSFAAVPLYRLFCQATGYGGTPKIGPAEASAHSTRTIIVRFDANTSPGLPWNFAPSQSRETVKLGDDNLAFYTARNTADRPVTGTALYTVTPDKAAKYFHKTACFCFDEQTLAAGQTMEFPLSFFVDPEILNDPNTRDLRELTLSYTFVRSLDDAARSGLLAKAGPHVGAVVR